MMTIKHSVAAVLILLGVSAAAPIIPSGPGAVDYYGRSITWQQLTLITRGAPTFSVTWQDAGGSHSRAFDTDAEATAFSRALIAKVKRDARTS